MFEQHLRNAIALNRARRDVYARRTGGRSRRLSNLLIGLERVALPVARGVDRKARRFQKRGIPVVKADFVSMDKVRPVETPPRFQGRAPGIQVDLLRDVVYGYRNAVQAEAGRFEFDAVCERSEALLQDLDETEDSTQSHFAMTRHLVESAAFAALHAPEYAEQSDGQTLPLSRLLVNLQVLSLPMGLRLDRMAQPLHTLGAGILVNDVPVIPFRDELIPGLAGEPDSMAALTRRAKQT